MALIKLKSTQLTCKLVTIINALSERVQVSVLRLLNLLHFSRYYSL